MHFASENLFVRVDAEPSEILDAFTLFDASELSSRPRSEESSVLGTV
jgi:hypothetical protein